MRGALRIEKEDLKNPGASLEHDVNSTAVPGVWLLLSFGPLPAPVALEPLPGWRRRAWAAARVGAAHRAGAGTGLRHWTELLHCGCWSLGGVGPGEG